MLIGVFLTLSIAIALIINSKQQKLHKEFPFKITLQNKDTLYLRNYTDKPFIIYFVDPECDACAIEMKRLSKKIDQVLSEYYLLFIVMNDRGNIASYLSQLHIYPKSGVFIGVDYSFKVWDYCHIEHIPTIIILDKHFIARKKLSSLKYLLDTL